MTATTATKTRGGPFTGAAPPLVWPGAVVGELVDRAAGLGPLQRLLDDPEIGEI